MQSDSALCSYIEHGPQNRRNCERSASRSMSSDCVRRIMAKRLLFALILCSTTAWSQAEAPAGRPLSTTSETDNQIATLQSQVRKAPGDYSGYDALGAAFLQKARETGDIDYYDLAEQTINKSLNLVPGDFRAANPLVNMALLCMGEHR